MTEPEAKRKAEPGFRHFATEAWAFLAIAALAFLGGYLVGDAGNSMPAEMHGVAAGNSGPGEGAMMETKSSEAKSGEELFTSQGCGSCHTLAAAGSSSEVGPNLDESLAPDDTTEAIEEMIVDPNAEVIEGYAPNVMPQDFGQTMSPAEVHALAEFLVASTPAEAGP